MEGMEMATSPAVLVPSRSLEDPLAHLPRTGVVEYPKGQTVYDQHQPSLAVYLVISGKVKVSRYFDFAADYQIDGKRWLMLIVDGLTLGIFHNASTRQMRQGIFQRSRWHQHRWTCCHFHTLHSDCVIPNDTPITAGRSSELAQPEKHANCQDDTAFASKPEFP